MSTHVLPLAVSWISVGLLAALTALAWRQQPRRAAMLFATTMLCATWWATTSALGLFSPSVSMQVFWASVEWAGVAFLPVAWFLFTLEYTRRDQYVTYRSALGLSLVPTATVSLVMTNSLHHLMYRSVTSVQAGELTVLDTEFGSWFWIQSLYAYVLVGVGVTLILMLAVENRDLYLEQVLSLLLMILPPTVGSLAYIFSIGPFDVLDPTPYTFVLSGFAGVVALKQYRFLDAVPVRDRIARESLIDEIDHGVVVVDARDCVVEMNPAAESLFGGEQSQVGSDAATVVPEYDRIDPGNSNERTSITVDRNGREGIYEVQVTDLDDGSGSSGGAVLVFHDVTEQRTRMQRLDVLNRVLRHNLRNEMNVVYGHADQIANGGQAVDPAAVADRIKEKALAMTAVGDRAREIDEILQDRRDADQTATLATLLEWEQDRLDREHPTVAVECESPESEVEYPTALETVLKILVEEIIFHSEETDLTLHVEATVDDGGALVVIRDSGSGIPASERRVLESGEETDLRHGSGLGLWLANWGVQAIDGDLAIRDDPTDGTIVEIYVPAANVTERESPTG